MKGPKKHKIILAGLLILVLGFASPVSRGYAKSSGSSKKSTKTTVSGNSVSKLTSDSIRAKEKQISDMEDEKKALQGNLSDLKKIKKDLEGKKSDLKAYVAQLDSQLADIEAKIEDLKRQIEDKEAEIQKTQEELVVAKENEDTQQKAMVKRIKLMYERNHSPVLDVLFGSGNFGGFLNRADTIERVMAYDKQSYEDFKTARQYVELCEEQLELQRDILQQTKENVEQEEANLEDLIAQKNKDIIAYESDISHKEQSIAEYEQMIREQDAEIAALEAAIIREKKEMLGGDVITYDGGVFKFPLANYTRVSDDYGYRIHPILGVKQFHNGIDFAAPAGTAIYAAYDGKVVAATYSSTMGNYIMIDHGDSLYTIYMHASALYVKTGEIVVKGEKIAAVGTTGRSTGNHLHFSVRLNGEYQSPWNYISK